MMSFLICTSKHEYFEIVTPPKSTHQAASVHTHSSRLLVAGSAVEHVAKVVVEVVANGEAAEFTGT